MRIQKNPLWWSALALCLPALAWAQPIVQEDFDGVTGVGGGEFFIGAGEGVISDWDTGLLGENAFAGATVRAFSHASATGDPVAGVDGSGAGTISVSDVTFNPLHLDFLDVSGNPGGGVFFIPDSGPEGYTDNWDNKISGEAAFGGVKDGAVLNGTMSAQAIPGAGYAQLDANDVDITTGSWYAGLMFAAPALEGAVTLLNGGFEDIENAADQIVGWVGYGNWGGPFAETATGDPGHPFTPYEGLRSLKMYGNAGEYQDMPAQAGQTWEINAYVMAPSNDPMGSDNILEAVVEFRDAADQIIPGSGAAAIVLTALSPKDIWAPITPVSATAPAGVVSARVLFRHSVPTFQGGAVFVDAATFTVTAGPPQSAVDLSTIELTATVRGTVDVAGETLGDYQLRIEDSDGDRLVFLGTANGDWQTIGGPLSTAIEMDSSGTAASGVFNTASPTLTVVLAFDNDTTVTWGTGGTLDVAELILSGTDPLDSAWYAGLFWNNLVIANPDLNELNLTADVKGNTVGGEYVLRLEGFVINSNGVDEPFTDATLAGNHVIVTYDMTTSGVTSGWTDNWDTGLLSEAAFGGLDTGSRFCSAAECPDLVDVGITASAVAADGNPGAFGQIRMTGLWEVAPGGDWWGGLMWQNQALAGGDLSQVELRADVRGVVNTSYFEQLGSIELRIEDEDGDRLYKQYTATENWQSIGGTLDTFTEAGPASGVGGSGAFDTDQANYTVVIAFNDPSVTWVWGGTIQVDNVYLTPAEVAVELGRVSFTGVSDTTFQGIGGVLSAGQSTFVTDLQEDMESGAGESLTFWPGDFGNANYDSGLTDDAYFGGTWGDGTVAAITAESCTTCGYQGSKGIRMIVENPGYTTSGGWWAGLAFNDQRVRIDNLADIIMTARVKGEPADGGPYGLISFKLEDPNLDAMEFLVVADGTWQSVGGPLSTATEIGSGNLDQGSDGVFDVNAPSYKVIVSTWGPPGGAEWITTHTVAVDDIFLTRPGYSIADADAFSVVLAFENEMSTWGTAGTLTLDNLLLSGATGSADCDADGDVDLFDFAAFQACFDGPVAGACECADIDGDNAIDAADLQLFTDQLNGPQ